MPPKLYKLYSNRYKDPGFEHINSLSECKIAKHESIKYLYDPTVIIGVAGNLFQISNS